MPATAEQLGEIVAAMSRQDLEAEIAAPSRLLLNREMIRGKTLETAWAPFDHINHKAAVAIVGITPGRQQMGNALRSYRAARAGGHTHLASLEIAKVHASFSGPLRDYLVRMLDHIGLNAWLGLASSAALWDTRPDLAHFTSALRHPVFVEKRVSKAGTSRRAMVNYGGDAPQILKAPGLRATVETLLAAELAALPAHCIIVPLGSKVGDALLHAADVLPAFDRRRILAGLPHPSGQNLGEIYPFLELPGSASRVRPVPASIAERRNALREQLAQLPARPRPAPA